MQYKHSLAILVITNRTALALGDNSAWKKKVNYHYIIYLSPNKLLINSISY